MVKQRLKVKEIVLPRAMLRDMKPETSIKISTDDVKTASLRIIASNLKHEGYLFRVSSNRLINETIVECLKTPKL